MSSILPIYKIDRNNDWAQVGNHNNWWLTARYTQDVKFLPFVIDNIDAGNTISEFKLRKLEIIGSTKTILSTETLNTANISIAAGVLYDQYYYTGTDLGITENGIYEFYIKNSNGDEWRSELMRYCSMSTTVFGDFNNDFNDDFLRGVTYSGGAVKITVTGLGDLFPSSYEDFFYCSRRIKQIGLSEFEVRTKEAYQTLEDYNYVSRLIQSEAANKYELIVLSGESTRVDYLIKALKTTVTDGYGKSYLCENIKVNSEKQGATDIFKHTITFVDLNRQNYNNSQPLISHLESNHLFSTEDINNLITLKLETQQDVDSDFTSSSAIKAFGKLKPRFSREQNKKTHTFDKKEHAVQAISEEYVNVKLYLTENKLKLIEKYINLADTIKTIVGSVEYTNNDSSKKLNITSKTGELKGIYEVDISYIYNINYHNIGSLIEADYPNFNYIQSVYNDLAYIKIEVNTYVNPYAQQSTVKYYTPFYKFHTIEYADQLSTKNQLNIEVTSTVFVVENLEMTFFVDKFVKNRLIWNFYNNGPLHFFPIYGTEQQQTLTEYPEIESSLVEGFEDLYEIKIKIKFAAYENDIYGS